MAKKPSMQFYPGDWLRDTALRFVSVAARGLWVDMLCLMHDCEPYGRLQVGGVPVDEMKLAAMTGVDEKSVKNLLSELESAEVFSRSKNGAIYSRRMMKDARISRKRKEFGKLGGNPLLVKPSLKCGDKQTVADEEEEGSSSLSLTLEGVETKVLTPQQVAVQSVLDAWESPSSPPPPGLAAKWNALIGAPAVCEIIQSHPTKPVEYIAKCVDSWKREHPNGRATRTNRHPDALAVATDTPELRRRDDIREAALTHKRDPDWAEYLAWLAPGRTMREDAMTFEEWLMSTLSRKKATA